MLCCVGFDLKSNFFEFEHECLVFLFFFLVNKVAREVERTSVELWKLWPDSFTILGMSGTSGGGASMTFLVPPSI